MNCKNGNHSCNSCGEKKCGNKHTACHNAGYRKASDVIEEVFLALDKRTEDEGLVFIKKSDIVNAIKNKKVEIARELFEEIDEIILRYLDNKEYSTGDMVYDLDKLKEKYESEGEG